MKTDTMPREDTEGEARSVRTHIMVWLRAYTGSWSPILPVESWTFLTSLNWGSDLLLLAVPHDLIGLFSNKMWNNNKKKKKKCWAWSHMTITLTKGILGAHWSSSIAEVASFSERSCLKGIQQGVIEDIWPLLVSACMKNTGIHNQHAQVHVTHTCTHIQGFVKHPVFYT